LERRGDAIRQSIPARVRVPKGWSVYRTAQPALNERARASFAEIAAPSGARAQRLDIAVVGGEGTPLSLTFTGGESTVTVASQVTLARAAKRALDLAQLREQLGRLGGTSFVLGAIDAAKLASGMFIPVSELNALRQRAVAQLEAMRSDAGERAT